MPSFGSDSNAFQAIAVPVVDPNGNTIIDTTNGVGSSPFGIAPREQIFFGIPNGSFSNLPQDPFVAIDDIVNPLPYWSVFTSVSGTVTSDYDSTTKNWGLKLDPGTAASGDYISVKARSFVANDDNLALRQKAFLTMKKNGTYAGSTQWKLELICQYYDATNTSVASATIGTVYDNATWTAISGTTTTGGSAFPSSAIWAEYEIKLTATAAVTSSTSVTLQSLIVASSTPATQSFVVVETFNASTTWTRPTGVTSLLGVIAIGGGGGGGGGTAAGTVNATVNLPLPVWGAPGGGSGSFGYVQNVYVGDLTTVSVGIGTAGAGGTANTITKAAAGTAQTVLASTAGGAGGASTFGTILTAPGGGGASGTAGTNTGGGTAGGAATTTAYGLSSARGTTGGNAPSNAGVYAGGSSSMGPYSRIAFMSNTFSAGNAGSVASTSGGNGRSAAGTAGVAGVAGIMGAGGGAGSCNFVNQGTVSQGPGADGGYGSGGGGGVSAGVYLNATSTAIVTGGAGGPGGTNSGAGGGGGGAAVAWSSTSTVHNASTLTVTSGKGGDGALGQVIIAYVS